MSEIIPVGEAAPETATASYNYTELNAKLAGLEKVLMDLQEKAEEIAQNLRADSDDVLALSELCAAADVDPTHTAAINEIAEAISGISAEARQVATGAETAADAAGVTITAHTSEYGGIYEAAQANGGKKQPKPGFFQH